MQIVTMIIVFIIAALSGMGVGGGGLFVIYLSLFTDTPQLLAQGINLLFFLLCAGASLIFHLQKRNIYFLAVAILAGAGIVGSLVGSSIAEHIDESILRKIFGAMLVISGIITLKRKGTNVSDKKSEKSKNNL